MTGTMDKIKAKVENVLHKDSHSTSTTHNDPTGPHGSHAANKADPRVDTDNVGGIGNTKSTGGYSSDPTGPHNAHLANKVCPGCSLDLQS